MNRLTIAATALAMSALPAMAQNVTIGEATEALTVIKADETKRQAYCEMQALYEQAGEAEAAQKTDEVEPLVKQAEAKGASIGPEFEKVREFDGEVNLDNAEGKKFFDAIESLEASCAPPG